MLELHEQGLIPVQIGRKMGFSESTARNRLVRLGKIALAPKPAALKVSRERNAPECKPNPVEFAYMYLNVKAARLEERDGNFHLDGKITGPNEIVRETNRILKSNGLPQLNANGAWLV